LLCLGSHVGLPRARRISARPLSVKRFNTAEFDRDESTVDICGGRRKFCEADDIALLNEALANNAHDCGRGKLTEEFEKVVVALNDSWALQWPKNGMHCTDRFKVLVANFRRIYHARSSAGGIEE
jgi:hypothetical protein